jgi:hypothetical protein
MSALPTCPARYRDCLVGALLCFSAVEKALARSSMPEQRFDIPLAGILVELFFGVWLFVGLYGSLTRTLSVALFICFLGVAAYRHWQGAGSCGCFGDIRVPPMFAAILDCAVLVALLAVRCSDRVEASRSRWMSFGLLAVLGSGALLSLPVLFRSDEEFEEIRLPELVDSRFPYLDDVDIGPLLAKGSWLVLLVQPGCEVCEQEISRCEEDARRMRITLAVVQLPSSVLVSPPSRDGRAVGSLSRRKRWIVRTPLSFRLDDGVVSLRR